MQGDAAAEGITVEIKGFNTKAIEAADNVLNTMLKTIGERRWQLMLIIAVSG